MCAKKGVACESKEDCPSKSDPEVFKPCTYKKVAKSSRTGVCDGGVRDTLARKTDNAVVMLWLSQ